MNEFLDKQRTYTFRQLGKLILAILLVITFVAAVVDSTKNKVKAQPVDTIETTVSDIQQYIFDMQEMYPYLDVIGAFTILNQEVVPPTKENVQELVMMCKAWYPDIIMAQYQLESNFGRSGVARNNSNLFGMKKAFARKSVRCKTFDKKGYAVYNNWPLSVVDRILWEEHMFNGEKPTREKYIATIKKIYAEDGRYISKINEIAKEYEYLYEK